MKKNTDLGEYVGKFYRERKIQRPEDFQDAFLTMQKILESEQIDGDELKSMAERQLEFVARLKRETRNSRQKTNAFKKQLKKGKKDSV